MSYDNSSPLVSNLSQKLKTSKHDLKKVGHCSLLLLGFVTSSDIVCQRSDTIVGGRHKRFIVFLEQDNLVLGTPVGAAGALLGCLAKVPVMEQSGMAIGYSFNEVKRLGPRLKWRLLEVEHLVIVSGRF
ncbi:hypothetical protein CDAR_567811 [Caerostris darwini]|uniref:Uncharacterized protein n=1 Tax=Caerostris darwini TaxID=1538125 RepID=A0AAV4RSA2_9ARAC|nr:hypothetical protein CDAR_567811 [Caerostris darwini]